MKTELKLSGADDVLKMLQSLPAEVVSKRGGPVRSSLRKGALVIHKKMISNLELVATPYSTGFLKQNTIVSRGKAPYDGKGERYLIRVRRKSYPDREGKGRISTQGTAQNLEYGTSKQPAEPWIRPAFASKAQEAINVTINELKKAVDKIAQKHLKRK